MTQPSYWSRIHPRTRYVIILASSLVVSIVGVALACIFRHPDYAARAGAISTIIGNGVILGSDYGRQVFEYRMKAAVGKPEVAVGKLQADALAQWLRINADGEKYQHPALVAAAILGTVFWGFGDLLAIHIMHWLGTTPICSC